jgi:hypothetical protein
MLAAVQELGIEDPDELTVQELTVQEFMLTALARAEDGLRRRSIDELEMLIEMLNDWRRVIPREKLPPEVVEFVRRRFKHVRGRLYFKRPRSARDGSRRGRMRSRRRDHWRFSRDPDRIAAHFAALYIAELRRRPGKPKRRGPYKVLLADGSKVTTHKAAVQRAVDKVNSSLRHARSSRRVRTEVVEELVRRGRTKCPESLLKW